MAGDWIKMRLDLSDDPAVIHLACALDMDEYSIVGRLHKLWSWADKHCSDGHAKSVTFVWINRYVCLDMFAENMEKVGWLELTDDGISFPNFDKHNGKSAKSRAEATERKRKERESQESHNKDLDLSHKICDKNVTREEKRREENINTLVISDAEDKISTPDKPDCPHQEIIAIYHQVLPQCPRIRDWTPARAIQLRARWNEDANRQNLDYWKRFFEYVATCDFLVGKGKTPFFVDLEWMTKQSNFTKIREEKYGNRS